MGRKINVATGVLVAASVACVAWFSTRPDDAVASSETKVSPATVTGSVPASRTSIHGPGASTSVPTPNKQVKPPNRDAAQGCALLGATAEDCPFLAPTDATLQEMARCGIARLEVPRPPNPETGIDAFPATWRDKAGVTDDEHTRLERAATAFAATQRQQWADLAADVGIDREWAETSPPVVVSTRIFATFDEDQFASAVERVARERAGWEPLGAKVPTALDAAVRLRLGAGDAYEVAIADAVGETRAAELRAAADGWPGSHGDMGNRCEVEPRPARKRDFVPNNADEAAGCIADAKANNCAFLDPTQHELDKMADCGVVRFDAPGFLGARFSEPTFDFDEHWADLVDLTPAEAAAIAEVGDEFRDSVYRDLTELVLEAGKSKAWADQTPFVGMMVAIAEGSGASRADTEQLLRRLAEERAGRAAAPADPTNISLDERFMRRVIELGNDFEVALADRLGPDRARALRNADDGWPGLRLQTQNYCDNSQPQMF